MTWWSARTRRTRAAGREITAFGFRRVAVAVALSGAVLALCSCSSPPSPASPGDPDSPTMEELFGVTSEITRSPSATPSPSPVVQEWTPTDYYVSVPQGITFPSQTESNYEYSDQPQGAAEQWIFDTAPDQWASGVRAVSQTGSMTSGYLQGDPPTPSTLVQFISGKR